MRVINTLARCVSAAISFVYPDVCQYCREERATPREGYVGAECRRRVRWIRPPYCGRCGLPYSGEISGPFQCANCHDMELAFTSGRAAVAADGMMLDLIHRWKYQGALWLEPFLAGLLTREMAAALAASPGGWNLLVPVPLHPTKEREREFNQAAHLARRVGAELGMRIEECAVVRQGATRTQTRLTREQRSANMRRAFGPGRRPESVRGRRVILIDDVLTTGATTSACAGVLRRSGAAEVCVWTLARGLLH